jgi:hypothetical protein
MLNALASYIQSLFANPQQDDLLIPVRVEGTRKQWHKR